MKLQGEGHELLGSGDSRWQALSRMVLPPGIHSPVRPPPPGESVGVRRSLLMSYMWQK